MRMRRHAHQTGFGDMSTSPDEAPDDVFNGDPDHAWKALGLVMDWIKHAETKAGATLAAAGVSGGVLYNLVKDQTSPGWWLSIAAVLCGVFVLAAGGCAALAFLPRLGGRAEEPNSLIYFKHIAHRHPTKPHTYFDDLHRLTASAEQLVREVAEQVWANSQVANRKYTWASRAVVCLVIAVAALAWVAWILAYRSVRG
jgi:peptidoglycan/LPS O-acetylase OafA/YrhL